MPRTTVITLAIVAGFSSLAFADEAASTDKEALQGKWRLIEREHKGKSLKNTDADLRGAFTIAISGNEMTETLLNGQQLKKTFVLDPSSTPKSMDVTSLIGTDRQETRAYIYKLEGDRLTLCMPGLRDNRDQRPKEFTTKGDGQAILFVFEREK